MKTIFADDNDSARLLMKKIMKKIDPTGTHLTAENSAKAMELLEMYGADVLFLDIEMPGISGIEAAHCIETSFPKTNIVFVTGHPEYARDALRVYCSGFIDKPFDEEDIRNALKHLRYPVAELNTGSLSVRCRGSFALYYNGEPLMFKRGLTKELFAYLVYKNGALCSNGELLGVLWDGDPNKAGFLRQLTKDMRDTIESVGLSDALVKQQGQLGLNTSTYVMDGELAEIIEEYGWDI